MLTFARYVGVVAGESDTDFRAADIAPEKHYDISCKADEVANDGNSKAIT